MAEDAALAAALKAYADTLDDRSRNEPASMEESASWMLRQHPNNPMEMTGNNMPALPMNELFMQELLNGGQFTEEAQQLLSILEEQHRQQQNQAIPSLQKERRRSDKHYFTIALDGTFLLLVEFLNRR